MAFFNSPGNELFKFALKLFLTQDQRHENGQQKETTNPDNSETVLICDHLQLVTWNVPLVRPQ